MSSVLNQVAATFKDWDGVTNLSKNHAVPCVQTGNSEPAPALARSPCITCLPSLPYTEECKENLPVILSCVKKGALLILEVVK